ncbi:hypothetical protein ACHAWF_012819 [Thalassiosira exigua]
MRTRNQSFRKGRISNIDRSNRFLPFPASASEALVIILCVSTRSALFIGIHRHKHATAIDFSGGSSGNVAERHDNIVTPRDAGHDDGPSIRSFQDLSPSEIHPVAGPDRHIVSPPSNKAPITLVTCSTTVGYLHILVHPSWAPLGAQLFKWSTPSTSLARQALMTRYVKGFLYQFGLAGDPAYNKPYVGKNRLEDDPNWLPEGPSHRTNDLGVKRFAKGYLAYAGAGPNSRTNQFIIALQDNGRLGGGSVGGTLGRDRGRGKLPYAGCNLHRIRGERTASRPAQQKGRLGSHQERSSQAGLHTRL